MELLICKKSRILEVWKCRGYGPHSTTYSKVDFEKKVKPKNFQVLSRNRNKKSKKIVNEDLGSVSWQCRACRQ